MDEPLPRRRGATYPQIPRSCSHVEQAAATGLTIAEVRQLAESGQRQARRDPAEEGRRAQQIQRAFERGRLIRRRSV